MTHPTVRAAVMQHFLDLFGFDSEDAAAAGNSSVRLKFQSNNEEIEEPRTREDESKAHLFIIFDDATEEGAALGEAGYIARREDSFFFVQLLTAAGKGVALADSVWATVKRSLRRPTIGAVKLSQDFAESDQGARYGGRWAGVAIGMRYFFYFDGRA